MNRGLIAVQAVDHDDVPTKVLKSPAISVLTNTHGEQRRLDHLQGFGAGQSSAVAIEEGEAAQQLAALTEDALSPLGDAFVLVHPPLRTVHPLQSCRHQQASRPMRNAWPGSDMSHHDQV